MKLLDLVEQLLIVTQTAEAAELLPIDADPETAAGKINELLDQLEEAYEAELERKAIYPHPWAN